MTPLEPYQDPMHCCWCDDEYDEDELTEYGDDGELVCKSCTENYLQVRGRGLSTDEYKILIGECE